MCNALAACFKVLALVSVLHLTHDLPTIAATAVVVVGTESVLFIWQIHSVSPQNFRALMGPIIRALVSGISTAVALSFVPGAWRMPVDMLRFEAVLVGGAIGFAAVVAQTLLHTMLWRISGYPSGPERDVAELASRLRDNLVAKLKLSAFGRRFLDNFV